MSNVKLLVGFQIENIEHVGDKSFQDGTVRCSILILHAFLPCSKRQLARIEDNFLLMRFLITENLQIIDQVPV